MANSRFCRRKQFFKCSNIKNLEFGGLHIYILLYILYNYHRSYTGKYYEFVAVCIATSAQHEYNNANGNKRVMFFSGIAWYYGDNDEPSLHVQTQRT